MKTLPRRALTLWRIRLTACAAPAPFLVALFFPAGRAPVWNAVLTGVWAAFYLFMFLFYYPVKHRKLSFAVRERAFVVYCGVFYSRIKAMELQNIQSVTFSASPLERAMGLATLSVLGAGALINVPSADEGEAEALCARLPRPDKRGRA